jgi:hypothetical protein
MKLPNIFVPVKQYEDQSFGFLTADLFEDLEGTNANGFGANLGAEAAGAGGNLGVLPRQSAVVAFADPNDAQQVHWLWQSWGEEGRNRWAVFLLEDMPAALCAEG